MLIWVVEDDPLQAEMIVDGLEAALGKLTLEQVSTEFDFRERLENLKGHGEVPFAVVLDVMLRWTDAGPDLQEPPAEVKKGGYNRAGFRCAKLLAEHPRASTARVVLYTVLRPEEIPQADREWEKWDHMRFMAKDTDLRELVEAIQEAPAPPEI